MKRLKVDSVIIGGGMIGLALACGLARRGQQVAVIERHKQPELPQEPALRVSALSHRSRRLLSRLGVWPNVEAFRTGPYQAMHVWDKDNAANIHFDAKEVNEQDIGAIAENAVVEHFLWQAAEAAGVHIIEAEKWQLKTPVSEQLEHPIDPVRLLANDCEIDAGILFGADGGRSRVRQLADLPITFWDYDQQGIVANIRTELPHQGVARQVFLPSGPLALLPTYDPHLCSIVWSADTDVASELMELADNPEKFAWRVQIASDNILGHCELDSEVAAFPLRMQYARQWYAGNTVLMGDAAHSIHPLAGQGANLGFADVDTWLRLMDEGLTGQRLFTAYQRERKADSLVMISAMEAFKRGFGSSNPTLKLIRAAAFALPAAIAPVKRKFVQKALGY